MSFMWRRTCRAGIALGTAVRNPAAGAGSALLAQAVELFALHVHGVVAECIDDERAVTRVVVELERYKQFIGTEEKTESLDQKEAA